MSQWLFFLKNKNKTLKNRGFNVLFISIFRGTFVFRGILFLRSIFVFFRGRKSRGIFAIIKEFFVFPSGFFNIIH